MTEIYGLFDKGGNLRYIGKANNSAKRLMGHMRECRRRRTPLYDWIKKHGLPELRVLYVCGDGEDWRDVERRFIKDGRAEGLRLLNIADGGDEPHCPTEVRRANGKKSSGPNGYLTKVKSDRLTGLVHQAKRDFPASLKRYEKQGLTDFAASMRERMRMLAQRLPHHFPRWADI